jgi:transcriptional regulator with XRE-family HTH domain
MHSLKLARIRAGMTLTELAEKSGVTPNTISQIERGGRVPQATTLYKLALALRVDAAVLVEREKATA